jgi:hypothetical protein
MTRALGRACAAQLEAARSGRRLGRAVAVTVALSTIGACNALWGLGDLTYGSAAPGPGGAGAGAGGDAGHGGAGGAAAGQGGTGGGGAGYGGLGGGPLGSRILGVQSAEVTLPAEAASVTAPLTVVDPARAFALFGARFDSTSTSASELTALLTASDVTFSRPNGTGAPAIPIRYYVAEFQSGVLVERGTTPMTTTSVTVSLATPVDPAKSFPLIGFGNAGANYNGDDLVRAKLTGPSELTLTAAGAPAAGLVQWQVVQYDEASVQSGDLTVAAADLTLNAPVQAVDPAKTWLLLSYQLAAQTGPSRDRLIRGRLSSTTELTFVRAAAASAGTLSWYAVTFSNATAVQHGTASLAELAATATAVLAPVDMARCIAVATGLYDRAGTSADLTSPANLGYGAFTLALKSATEIEAGRGAVGTGTGAADVDWSVVQFR